MARLDITPAIPLGSFPSLQPAADSADLNFVVPGTYTDGIGFLNSGREVLVVHNTGASPYTVTISSVPYLGRSGDITTYSIGAGEHAMFGPFNGKGWNQSDGKVYAVGSNASVKFAVIRLPGYIFEDLR